MNEETAAAETTETTPAETAEAPKRVGRGRPQETIDRDATVLTKLLELVTLENERFRYGITRNDLAEAAGIAANVVYLSLFRLNRDGKISRATAGARALWIPAGYVVPERPAPEPTPTPEPAPETA